MLRLPASLFALCLLIYATLSFCDDSDDTNQMMSTRQQDSGDRNGSLKFEPDIVRIQRSAKRGKGKGKKGKNKPNKGKSCKKKKLTPVCLNKKFTNKIKAIEKKIQGVSSMKELKTRLADLETSL